MPQVEKGRTSCEMIKTHAERIRRPPLGVLMGSSQIHPAIHPGSGLHSPAFSAQLNPSQHSTQHAVRGVKSKKFNTLLLLCRLRFGAASGGASLLSQQHCVPAAVADPTTHFGGSSCMHNHEDTLKICQKERGRTSYEMINFPAL